MITLNPSRLCTLGHHRMAMATLRALKTERDAE